jgi:hypothetical protein
VIFLVLGIFAYLNESSQYGVVILTETKEWAESPIVQIIG